MLDPEADKRLIERLAALQSELGELNDIAAPSEAARLARTSAATAEAAFAAGAMFGARRSALPGHIVAARRAFRRLERTPARRVDLRSGRTDRTRKP